MGSAFEQAYGRPPATEGKGASIPLWSLPHDGVPRATSMLLGVDEPRRLIRTPNEYVDPSEIERMAVAEALLLNSYATAG